MLTRRETLTLAGLAGMAVLLPVDRLANAARGGSEVVSTPPFTSAMPIPPVLRPVRSTRTADHYEVRIREAQLELVPGLLSTVRTYDGHLPGPTIRAVRGRTTVVTQINQLGHEVAVHLHGAHVPATEDGHPMDVIPPGGRRTYTYPNVDRAASLWYHDHAHHLEAQNVYYGLSGAYLVSDLQELALGLPSGPYDVPLQIRDARVEADGTLVYTRAAARPQMLVNGKERPYFPVAGRKYRLRLFNQSIDRYLTLRLSDGAEFWQIASDGGLLTAPVPSTAVKISAGERVEIVVDFSRYGPGSSVFLQNSDALSSENPDVLRFDVGAPVEDHSVVPKKLSEIPPPPTATVERNFVLSFDATRGVHLINGQTFDPNRVDVRTRLGTTEIWRITNAEGAVPPPNFHVSHNFHPHVAQFRVLDRDGVPPAPGEAGLKDTVFVPPGSTVRIAVTWTGYAGRYVYHCHQLPHSVEAMMGTIEIEP
ncbi:multicopper oxidase family protein [Micromonospora sp. KC213]|uniref:multicopper oxidase family protein n=1 Tax=Micromonospora sp. KC213 TaxID=2530378 RepID=UPI001045CDA9|nr:multicopper oxidase family protein [Micromonospora sp. KC213]TDC42860.1 multicopper oxidase family protein [Micromonospora sp. KC213]